MEKKEVKKPWGGFKQFTLNEKSTVKILTIEPKQAFSLQYHKNRTEFWYFLDNPAKVTIGNKTFNAKKGSEFIIKPNQHHRIGAYSKTVNVLEVSFGEFDENDIIRLEDRYGRV